MDKVITWELTESVYSGKIRMDVVLGVLYADDEDYHIKVDRRDLFEAMRKLAEKYNNRKDGSVGVDFCIG